MSRDIFFSFLSWCPGALGLWLRQKFYPAIFRDCGSNVLFGRFVIFKNPQYICLGNNVVINDYVELEAGEHADDAANIFLENEVFLGNGSRIIARSGEILIKSGASLGSDCLLRTCLDERITIGENVLLAAYCTIISGEEPNLLPENKGKFGLRGQGRIIVGNGCWLGVRTKLTSGSIIGAETVVGAHSWVESELPAYVVAVGRPAQVLCKRNSREN